jgi:hypothetical protein
MKVKKKQLFSSSIEKIMGRNFCNLKMLNSFYFKRLQMDKFGFIIDIYILKSS